jgi:hypothetical protein
MPDSRPDEAEKVRAAFDPGQQLFGESRLQEQTPLGILTQSRYEELVRKEVFVCDNCGARKRLDSAQRHWCEECKTSSPVELRPARDKRPVPAPVPATSTNADRHWR